MRFQVGSEQIEALNRGEMITVLVRMEPQPESGNLVREIRRTGSGNVICLVTDPDGVWQRDADPPVSCGDAVKLTCKACDEHEDDPAFLFEYQHRPCSWIDAETADGRVCATAYRKVDGIHNWEVRLQRC